MNILVTGFSAWGKNLRNPSAVLVTEIDSQKSKLITHIFPTSFSKVESQISEILTTNQFDFIIAFGLRKSAKTYDFELFANNLDNCKTGDIDGEIRVNKPIINGGLDKLSSHFPFTQLTEIIDLKKYPISLSSNCGHYVCNHSYYLFLNYIRENRLPTKCLFIHIPKSGPEFTSSQNYQFFSDLLEIITKHSKM